MKTILLAGNSFANKVWIESVAAEFGKIMPEVFIHYYDHWEEGGDLLDIESELKKLINWAEAESEYNIFAKSAGCLVVLEGIYQGLIHPQKCIFTGLPVTFADSLNIPIRDYLKGLCVPALFLQKTKDPAIKFTSLKALIEESGVKNAHFSEIAGDNHYYENIQELAKEASVFFG